MTYDKASSKLDLGGKRYGYDELLCSLELITFVTIIAN